MDDSVLVQKEVGAAWLAYAMLRTKLITDREKLELRNRSADDYAIELGAREGMIGFWARQPSPRPSSPYLDTLALVYERGFLEEYVLAYFGKPGWTIPFESLAKIDMRAFVEWADENLAGHEPETRATVRSSSFSTLVVPGGALPDPNSMSPSVVSCARSAAPLAAALDVWEKERLKLDGIPISARDHAHLFQIIDWARQRPEYTGKGFTWVSPAAAQLLFLKGFCAIDAGDYAGAIEPLRLSAELDPLSPGVHLESSHAHAKLMHLDQADAAVDRVLVMTSDPCALARAWRQRGFIFVEREKLPEALDAYNKSLEYEPKNALAASQIRITKAKLEGAGKSPLEKTAKLTHTTRCD